MFLIKALSTKGNGVIGKNKNANSKIIIGIIMNKKHSVDLIKFSLNDCIKGFKI